MSSNEISSSIDQKLAWISSKTSSNNNTNCQFIYRIHNTIRMTNEAAYEPEMVSIGPYHRGKKNLQKMEKYKLEYLQKNLERQKETSAHKYVVSLLCHEEKARSYYAEEVSMNSKEFVEMMLLDGCFIIEFLRKYRMKNYQNEQDPIFKMDWISEIIRRDLLLFENQIPFFILDILFDHMTDTSNNATAAEARENLISLAVYCMNGAINYNSLPPDVQEWESEVVFHLLSLMYYYWCSSISGSNEGEETTVQSGSVSKPPLEFSCINFGRKNREDEDEDEENLDDINFIKTVNELNRDGIKLVKAEQNTSWLNIKFENGEIKISPFIIQDGTESILRNLIAYEHYMFDSGYSGKFITDYATFMDCLINTPIDTQKLRVKGIVKNWLGNDEEVTEMFNNICKNISISPSDFTYRKIFKDVNKYCNDKRNQWCHDLKTTHFTNPWSIVSLIAAIVLLILTFIQTVFSFLEYFKKDPKVVCSCK